MIFKALRIVGIATALSATPLAAQQAKPLQLDMTNGWTHEQSGLVFPKEMGALPFLSATEFAEKGWNVALQYSRGNQADSVSVYVYQAAVQDIGLLFAESRRSIEGRKQLYTSTSPLAPVAAFTPPGQKSASGLRIVYNTGGAYKSTALAIVPMGRDWVVKFRISSTTLSAAELDARLTDTIAMLGWPADKRVDTSAQAAVQCINQLPEFSEATELKSSGAYALESATSALTIFKKMEEEKGHRPISPRYCRDKDDGTPFAVYRPDDVQDRYMISLGDSGKAVFVEPDPSRKMRIAKGESSAANAYAVSVVLPGYIDFYPSFDRMPSPEQAMKIVNSTKRLSRTSRNDGDAEIQIDPSLMK
jgi:hypothetical protein